MNKQSDISAITISQKIKEYKAGYASGKLHNPNDPLCIANIKKMKQAFNPKEPEDLIFLYWLGYRDGMNSQTSLS